MVATFLPWLAQGDIAVNGYRGALGGNPGIYFVGFALLLILNEYTDFGWLQWVSIAVGLVGVFLAFNHLWRGMKYDAVGYGVFLLIVGAGLGLVVAIRQK